MLLMTPLLIMAGFSFKEVKMYDQKERIIQIIRRLLFLIPESENEKVKAIFNNCPMPNFIETLLDDIINKEVLRQLRDQHSLELTCCELYLTKGFEVGAKTILKHEKDRNYGYNLEN